MVQMKKISTAMTPTIKTNRTNTPTMYPPSTLRTLMISRLFYSRFERYRRRQQLRKNGSCHSSPSVKPPISSLFALFVTMPFDGAQPSTCSSVHCISDELSICGLNPNRSLKSFRCHLTSGIWLNSWSNSCIRLWWQIQRFRQQLSPLCRIHG